MEPLPGVETAQPYGSRRPNAAGVGDYDSGREPRRAQLSDNAQARLGWNYRLHLAGKPRL
jgi:hypothetical protein